MSKSKWIGLGAVLACVFVVGWWPPEERTPSPEVEVEADTAEPRTATSVSGRVVDADGAPLVGAHVLVMNTNPEPVSAFGGSGTASGYWRETDAEGRFSVPVLGADASYEVTIGDPGLGPAGVRRRVVGVPSGTSGLVVCVGGPPQGVRVRLLVAGEGPLDHAPVELRTGATTLVAGVTDDEGRVELAQATTSGTCYLCVASWGFTPIEFEMKLVEGEVSDVLEPIVVRRRPGACGRVFDADGTPAEGAEVWNQKRRRRIAAVTDAGGRFWIEPERSETLDLVVRFPGHRSVERRDVPLRPGRVHVIPEIRLERR